MGSGRGDRNQMNIDAMVGMSEELLQWGPVVVTGIRTPVACSRGPNRTGFNGVRSW